MFLLLLSLLAIAEPAELVLRGVRIVTVDEDQPVMQALAVRGERIVALSPSV